MEEDKASSSSSPPHLSSSGPPPLKSTRLPSPAPSSSSPPPPLVAAPAQFTGPAGKIELPAPLTALVEKYSLVHHHSLPYGNCGWISVGLALGWSPHLVARLYATFLQESIDSILGWLFPGQGDHRAEINSERKRLEDKKEAIFQALQKGDVASNTNPTATLERGAWMGNDIDLK